MQNQPQSITVDFEVPATMHDGTILRANIYRTAGGHWPVLLTRLPAGPAHRLPHGKALSIGGVVLDCAQAALPV